MTAVRIQERAAARLEVIDRYTLEHWGKDQEDRYLYLLFESFEQAAAGDRPIRPLPAEFGLVGAFYNCQKHFVYWKPLESGEFDIVADLHERMHQIGRLKSGLER